MPSIEVAAVAAAFAADGDTTGKIQVASSANFFVGTIGYLQRDDLDKRCVVVAVPDGTHVQVRIIADDNEQQGPVQRYGGFSDLTGWTTAKHSTVSVPQQIARVEPSWQSARGLNA